jgi:hypothetical protein
MRDRKFSSPNIFLQRVIRKSQRRFVKQRERDLEEISLAVYLGLIGVSKSKHQNAGEHRSQNVIINVARRPFDDSLLHVYKDATEWNYLTIKQFFEIIIQNPELKLLDSIGTAEMERKVEKKVLEVTKLNAENLMQESGIEPTLTNEEISNLLGEVKKELSITKKENPEGESQV